jgi:signal transduction histidine kinase
VSLTREELNVLVVDDENVLCQGVRRVLEPLTVEVPEHGAQAVFRIRAVGSGEECLRQLSVQAPDVLLLDHKLPGMTGLELLNRIFSPQQSLLVVMITAYANLDTAVRATKLGAYDFLAKPFTPDELRGVMRKAATHVVLSRRTRKLEAEKRQIRFEFLSVLAHELKAPLNAVEGYMDILHERLGGEELGMVERSSARLGGMKKLIYDLLDLTRIESGAKRRELKLIDLAPLLRGAVEVVARDAQQRRIRVELEVPGPVPLHADAGEMEIIFNNLLSNAVKYNRDEGRVLARLRRDGDRVSLEVEDTGIGLTAEEMGKLFREFVRIRNDETANILGSGLGLSTVKKLARLYGGDAVVRSTAGVGSTFVVTLCDGVPEAPQGAGRAGGSYAASPGD